MENNNNTGRNIKNETGQRSRPSAHGADHTARGTDRSMRPTQHARSTPSNGVSSHSSESHRHVNGSRLAAAHTKGTNHGCASQHHSGGVHHNSAAQHRSDVHHSAVQHHSSGSHHGNAPASSHSVVPRNTSALPVGTIHAVQSARRAKTLAAGRRRKKRYTILFSLFAFLAVMAVVCSVLWRIVDTYEPTVDLGPQSPDTSTVTGDPNFENAPLYTSTAIARKSGFYTMLLVGHDAVAVNTDVIMLVSFDVEGGALSVMQIPRDTYIETNGRSRKINSVYGLMRDDSISGKSERIASGMEGLADVIEEGIGIPIDFWAIIDLDGFDGIIDAIGGVEMDVPYDMDYEDPEQDLYIHLKKGLQTLTGEEAEQFVRFRDSYAMGDIGRVDAQKVFMSALFNQLKENLSPSGVTKLAEKTIPLVNTDMKVLDCVYFGKHFLKGVDLEKITFVTLPGESTRENGTTGLSYYVMRRSDMLQLVNKYFNPYTTDLTENSIDRGLVFNSEDNEFISKIYLAPSVGIENLVHDANGIMDGALDIAIKGE